MEQLAIVARRPVPYPGNATASLRVPPACIFRAPFSCLYRTTFKNEVMLADDLPRALTYPFGTEPWTSLS